MHLYTSNRMEVLVAQLADTLAAPLDNPFQPETIVVQSKGMERWIALELARLHGICANIKFPFPRAFIYDIYRRLVPDSEGEHDSFFEPTVMAWRIMSCLPALITKPEFGDIRRYLDGDNNGLKRFQLACRLAHTFDQYLIYRPDTILAWEQGANDQWQSTLWRALNPEGKYLHPPGMLTRFLDNVTGAQLRVDSLPSRVAVFGISSLPPFYLRILSSMADLIQINLFIMNPCREWWSDIVSNREQRHIIRQAGTATDAETLHMEKGNPLLAAMGRLGREFLDMVNVDHDIPETPMWCDPGEAHMLDAIQSDILKLRDRGADNVKTTIAVGDCSIRVHSCHSPMREIEVLHDNLLEMFQNDPELAPRDVIVMTPDIGTYAPFIDAVFDRPIRTDLHIPYAVADRVMRSESETLDAFLTILELADSRRGSAAVLDFLDAVPVRRRFGLTPDETDTVRHWVTETRIHWGEDSDDRCNIDLPGTRENTWRHGLDRLLLGYAMTGEGEHVLPAAEILPFDNIEGVDESETLGRFVEFVDQLFKKLKRLRKPRPLDQWARELNGLIDVMFAVDDDTEAEIQVLRGALNGLSSDMHLTGLREAVSLDVIRSFLKGLLATVDYGHGFITGGITFGAMVPMRSIPFKVVCLIGMDDRAYPRYERSLSFDLIGRSPRPGDRSCRDDDRYLFLEAVLSARSQLYISYVGQSIRDNSRIPPSVLVSELLDCITAGFQLPGHDNKIGAHVLVEHRLQPFSPAYFTTAGPLFSYSAECCRAGGHVAAPEPHDPGFLVTTLPEPEAEWRNVDVQQLCRFFRNPAEYLVRHRLGIDLESHDVVVDEREPFLLDALDRYDMMGQLTEKQLGGVHVACFESALRGSGRLPHANVGAGVLKGLAADVEAYTERLQAERESAPLAPLGVDLDIAGFRISGQIDGIFPGRLLAWRCAALKPADRLRLWIHHLLFNIVGGSAHPATSVHVASDKILRFKPVDGARDCLARLLDYYWDGLQRPLPFFPRSSLAFAESALGLKSSKAGPIELARRQWEDKDFGGPAGEGGDPYIELCFRAVGSFPGEFGTIARDIYAPTFEHGTIE